MDKTPFLQYLKEPITVPRWAALLTLGVMETGLMSAIGQQKKQRQEFLKLRLTSRRALEEAWPHLPPEVREKINTDIEFFNISRTLPID